METTQTKQVQFTLDNVAKCQCLDCPVQTDSQCAMDQWKQAQSAMGPGAMGTPSPHDVPKVH